MRGEDSPHPVLRNRYDIIDIKLLQLSSTPVPQAVTQPPRDRLSTAMLCCKDRLAHDVAIFRGGKDAIELESVSPAVTTSRRCFDVGPGRRGAPQAILCNDRQPLEASRTRSDTTCLDRQVIAAQRA